MNLANRMGVNPVLRISQLDALELDSSLEQLMWSQFSRCFQNFRPGLLTPAEPELRALLHLLVWKFTLYPNSATVGQSILNVRYHNTLSASPRYRPLSRRQKLGLALLTVGPRWLQERSHNLLVAFGLGPSGAEERDAVKIGLRNCSPLCLASCSLPIFSTFGVFAKGQAERGAGHFLPVHEPRAAVARIRQRRGGAVEGVRVCGEHVFCYYCIKSHSIADAYLTCPKCGAEAGQPLPVVMELEER
uniref:RING-type E3 ubiquitin transferase (cysteine targeting) n=1 Tax=Neogobius melanostomus TaxID=47308 RepID=A0A8C6T751_9GOBI